MDIKNICRQYSNRIFGVDYLKNNKISYKKLLDNIYHYLNIFINDLSPNDNVVIFIGNKIEYQIAFFSVLAFGGIPTPLNPDIPLDTLKEYLEIISPEIILCTHENEQKLQKKIKDCKLFFLILTYNILCLEWLGSAGYSVYSSFNMELQQVI